MPKVFITFFFILSISLSSCTPASSPMEVEFNVEGEPIVGALVDIVVTISTREVAENIDFSLSLSSGLELVSGSPTWQGELKDGESISLPFTVKIHEVGDWPLAAYAFNAYSEGSDAGFGGGETIYFISRQDSGEVVLKSNYKGTPSSPALNWPEGTLPPTLSE